MLLTFFKLFIKMNFLRRHALVQKKFAEMQRCPETKKYPSLYFKFTYIDGKDY